jgi:2-aminoadipate transaminase
MEKRPLYSRRIENLQGSPIRETLRMASRPGMVSFAGGLPSPQTFPSRNLETLPKKYLQYGPTEGEPELRALLARDLRVLGLDCGPDQVIVLSGSQQGIDLVAKLFIDPGSQVAVESPTYLAALQVFRFFRARFTVLDAAEPDLGRGPTALAYLNPTFQNPTGKCLSLGERRRIAGECDKGRVPLFEDDPYRDLAYGPSDRTPICSMVKKAPWVYQGSFSKTLAPGLRIGFLAASKTLVPFLNRLKQAADLHTNRIGQWWVLNHLRDPGRKARLDRLVLHYRQKRDSFAKTLQEHFSGIATWSIPVGGLFFWLALRRPLDTRTLFKKALRKGVAFMPGEPFFVETPAPKGFIRLNFSHSTRKETDKGLSCLAGLIKSLK